jgi:hypothetical protein
LPQILKSCLRYLEGIDRTICGYDKLDAAKMC